MEPAERVAAPSPVASPHPGAEPRTPEREGTQERPPSLGERWAAASSGPPRTESQRLRASNDERAHLIEITDDNFGDEVVESPILAIVDFWAETCVPCKLMHPVMRRLAAAFAGRARVGRLNVYENPRTTEALGIKAIPHLIVVRQGDIVLELVGDRSFEDLRAKLLPFVA